MSEQTQQLSGGEGFATGSHLDDAQNAIMEMFDGTLEEEQAEGDEEIVDESPELGGEVDESEVEESDEDFDNDEEAELDDDEYDQDEDESAQAETFTVKVDGEQV